MGESVRFERVTKQYRLGKTEIPALRGVDLVVEQGDILCLMGPSGSGKSTVLNLMGAIDNPSSGRVLVNGEDTASMGDARLSAFRNRTLGFIFQSFNLVPVLSLAENIEYPLILQHVPRKERRRRVRDLLGRVGLEGYERRRPDELSGGQRQRVAVARALITRPLFVIADEPTASLDHATGEGIMALMLQLNREYGTTLVFATHDPRVSRYARTLVRMEDGIIAEIARQEPAS
jgi:putative ABC transport system ATP-binding protein